jgi:hypothetical protein
MGQPFMIRDVITPDRSGFLLLRVIGAALTFVGALFVLAAIAYFVLPLLPGQPQRLWLSATPEWFVAFVILMYGVASMTIGQLLHWLVAIWRAQRDRADGATVRDERV